MRYISELSPASVYVSLLPVVEACVVIAVPGRVGEVRVAADEPEADDLDTHSRCTFIKRGTRSAINSLRAKQPPYHPIPFYIHLHPSHTQHATRNKP